jgi:hypothetical protein
MQKTPKLTMPQTCMTANFYDAARDYPKEVLNRSRTECWGTKQCPI